MNDLMHSRALRITLFSLGGLILLTVGFALGVNVGERKGMYFRAAFFPPHNLMDGRTVWISQALPGAHGVFGEVVSVAWPGMMVEDRDFIVREVIATSSTQIRAGRQNGQPEDVRAGASVSIFGMPDASGRFEAKLIRISPPGERLR